VVAIKDGSWEVARYEANRRLVKDVAPGVAVMGSGDEHLMASYVVGSEGSLVSLSVVIPETIIALYEAVRKDDMVAARAAHAIIYPLAKAIYGTPPGGYATARLKTCLKLLGKLENDLVRPPIGPLPAEEVTMLCSVLETTGLLS
jgi:4-hydroxy-tetrahydrodipicolinate synthase